MNEAPIQELLQKIAFENDQESFRMLYFQFYKKLYNLASFYLKSPEAVEEVVNDTFVTIWSNRHQLPAIVDFTSYIYKAGKNKSLNLLKLRNLSNHLHLDDFADDIKDESLNVEDQLIVSDLHQLIEKAVSKLPPQCKLVFKMIREDHLSHKEVAELLNISVRTIEYHMSIALKKLSESLNYQRTANRVLSSN